MNVNDFFKYELENYKISLKLLITCTLSPSSDLFNLYRTKVKLDHPDYVIIT